MGREEDEEDREKRSRVIVKYNPFLSHHSLLILSLFIVVMLKPYKAVYQPEWIDLEQQVYVSHLHHQRVYWSIWRYVWYGLLILLVLGYCFTYGHAWLRRRSREAWLVGQGEPPECLTSRLLARGETVSLSDQVLSWLNLVDHEQVCERYYEELHRLQWGRGLGLLPSPWMVAVDLVSETMVQPLKHVIDLFATLSRLQVLMMILVIGMGVMMAAPISTLIGLCAPPHKRKKVKKIQ